MEEVEIGNFGIGRKRWIARQTMPWLGRGGDAEMIICAAAAPFAIPAIAIEYKESNSSTAKAARYLLRNTTPCVNAGSIQRQPLPWMRDHPTKRPASRHNSSVRQVAYPTIKLFGKTLILVEGLMGCGRTCETRHHDATPAGVHPRHGAMRACGCDCGAVPWRGSQSTTTHGKTMSKRG